nr:hypothetical protein [Nitrospirota bacterium]
MLRRIRRLILLLLVSWVPCAPILAQASTDGAAIETVGPGTVNWTTGIVTAVGIGAPPEKASSPGQARAMADRAAFAVAIRNLLEVVKGIQVDSATLVESYVIKDDVIKTRVTGLVKGAQVIKKEVQPDGGVEVTVGVSLAGELFDAVVPKGFGRKVPAAEATKPAPKAPEPMPLPKASAEPPPAVAAAEAYTGLLVDARGLGLRPALAPKLLDEQGKELYASEVLDRAKAVEAGVAGYAKDMVAGSRQARVTDNPLIVKGVKASGDKATDVTIAGEGVKAIRQSEPMSHFLQQGRVVVVYD